MKVLADARKAYGLAPDRGGPSMPPTPMEKAQAAKIKGKERMLRAAVNDGEGNKGDSVFFFFFFLTCIESPVLVLLSFLSIQLCFQGIRLPPDQREITTALPPHMVDALFVNNAGRRAKARLHACSFFRSIPIFPCRFLQCLTAAE